MSSKINTNDAIQHALDGIHLRLDAITVSHMPIGAYFPSHNHHTPDAGSDGELSLLSLDVYNMSQSAQA
jgi:hypothetical protein